MRLRVAIILVLCCFGVGPLLLAVGLNVPAVINRLEQAAQQESLVELQRDQFALRARVEGFKERIASLAVLPGAADIIGYQGAESISVETARSRFVGLVSKWFAGRPEVLEIRLLGTDGQDRLHLRRQGEGSFTQISGGPHVDYEQPEFCKQGMLLTPGTVEVSEVEPADEPGGEGVAHRYALSLLTPVVAGKGQVVGVLACRLNISDFLHDYARSFWAVGGGVPPHGHEDVEGHHRDVHNHVGELERFPGLDGLLVGRKAVIWSGGGDRVVAWQPVLFNEQGPAILWLGHQVDRSGLLAWRDAQQTRLLVIVAALVVGVILLAGRLGAVVDGWRTELLAGLDTILIGERSPEFRWKYFRELRQLAGELNGLARRYADMQGARQRAEDELRQTNNQLEETVARRTAELYATNEQLSEEVEERTRAEEELRRHRDHLEELVRKRVIELAETNERLELEIVRRRRAQDSLRENEVRLRTILDSMDIGTMIVDRETRAITYTNPAAAAMIGAASAEVMAGLFCHDYFCQRRGRHFCSCIDGDKIVRQAARTLTRVDGSDLEVVKTVIPIIMDGRRCVLESITDISELKRIGEQNQALQEQLLQSQKMEAIGVLAGGVAHDFNNLLTVIQGSTEIVLMHIQEADAGHYHLEQIKEASARAGNLVRQLLLFSRTQPVTFTPLALNGIVENLLKMLARLIGEDIEVKTDLAEELWTIRGDAGTIEQVIMNLALNGRDAMSGGGVLEISTTNVELDESALKRSPEARPGRFVALEVRDSGGGIDSAVLPHIFEPFYTTKEAGKGTGLGLAVVYGIAKQHGGWIEVVSGPATGTAFKVYLPVAMGQAAETQEVNPADTPCGQGERILVVEDEELLRAMVTDMLTRNGYRVLSAVDAAEALEIYEREGGQEGIDLLFCDVVLPGARNGIELADLLRADRADLPVILTSGYPDQKSQWPVIVERGFPFLQKPFSTTALLELVAETIG